METRKNTLDVGDGDILLEVLVGRGRLDLPMLVGLFRGRRGLHPALVDLAGHVASTGTPSEKQGADGSVDGGLRPALPRTLHGQHTLLQSGGGASTGRRPPKRKAEETFTYVTSYILPNAMNFQV